MLQETICKNLSKFLKNNEQKKDISLQNFEKNKGLSHIENIMCLARPTCE